MVDVSFIIYLMCLNMVRALDLISCFVVFLYVMEGGLLHFRGNSGGVTQEE